MEGNRSPVQTPSKPATGADPLPSSGGENRGTSDSHDPKRYASGPPLAESSGTLTRMFFRTVERYGDKPALLVKQEGEYRPVTYRELADQVRALGRALLRLDLQPGENVALLAENRPEWAIADLATICCGGAAVGIYTTLTPPQIRYILQDSGAKILFVSDEKLLQKVLEIRSEQPQLWHILLMEEPTEAARSQGILSYRELLNAPPDPSLDEEIERRWQAVRPEDLAALIYTSGTTGEPKGARLTHNNFYTNVHAVSLAIEVGPADSFLSFIPLCHVFARMGNHYLPLYLGSTTAYAESIFTVQRNLEEAKPTVLLSVPRLYEAMQDRILETAAKAPPVKKRLFDWALKVGYARSRAIREGRGSLWVSLQYPLADRLVLKKIREKVTGGKLRYFVSGGAALRKNIAEFFDALGIIILEGYGLTETSPVICVNRPESNTFGTVGPPIPGVEVMIAEDGEILSRGPHIMEGYHGKPEETRKAIDAEGWYHTGDIGRLDEAGRLKITDRKKDIIVLATGKNVAPQPIESAIKESTYIANVALVGDHQNTISALVAPNLDALKRYAEENSLGVSEPAELVSHPQVKKLIKSEIDWHTTAFADFEKVRKFTLLDHDFSQDPDLITPTLKLKRRLVMEKYAREIAAMSA